MVSHPPSTLSSQTLGVIVIFSSFCVAVSLCMGVCVALWCRKLRGRPSKSSPVNLIVHRQPRIYATPSSLLFPTISQSETGSEPCTPISTLTSMDRFSPQSRMSTPTYSSVDSPLSEVTDPIWKIHNMADEAEGDDNRQKYRDPPSYVFKPWESDVEGIRCEINEGPISFSGLGEIKIKLLYRYSLKQLRVIVYSAHGLPLRFHNYEGKLYVKMIVREGTQRLRYQSHLIPPSKSPAFCTTFRHSSSPSLLSQASVTLSVCQDCSGRRVVAGSASISLNEHGFNPSLSENLETEILMLPLNDSSPEQQVFCGGEITLGICWKEKDELLEMSNMIISNFNIDILRKELAYPEDRLPWVYLKVCVFERGSLVCWRRTRPVPLYHDLTPLEDQLQLVVPPTQLAHLQLVLSVRQKAQLKGGRRVLGGVTIGEASERESGRAHWRAVMEGNTESFYTHHLGH